MMYNKYVLPNEVFAFFGLWWWVIFPSDIVLTLEETVESTVESWNKAFFPTNDRWEVSDKIWPGIEWVKMSGDKFCLLDGGW